MPSKRYGPLPAEGKEIPISVQAVEPREEMLWTAQKPAGEEAFPPCIKGIMAKASGEKGKHRTAAILASFLGQAGYSREGAKELWSAAAAAEERIFEEWFLKMHCPKCRAMQRQSKGYPDLGIADLGLCRPDEACQKFDSPVEYACRIHSLEDREKGALLHIKTQYRVRIFDWSTGQEGEIELSEREKETIEALLAEKSGQNDKILVYARVRVRGKLKPRFFLRDLQGPRRQMLSDVL
ncbi:MAG: hypothetical protein M0Q13_10020 [Methanothrix sp.]|jgi:hypothetical protein|nr:hypothetical protein [Methanothrix sp.]